jgi:hypothetical protein
MKKPQIIGVLVLLAALGAFGAVYQFYFAEKLEKYKQDEMFKDQLETTYFDLEEFFDARDPDMLVSEWKSQVQPWVDARNDRAQFFSEGDWYEYEAAREEGGLLRVWYGEKSNEMIYELYQRVNTSGLYGFPQDIRQEFGVPYADDWANVNVTEKMVTRELRQLSFGIALCEALIDAKVRAINRLDIWDPRERPKDQGLLVFRTVGVDCYMSMKDFIDFVEDELMLADRYFEIDQLRISNPQIAASRSQEPVMQIQFLLTQARYVGNTDQGASGAPGAPGMQAGGGGPGAQGGAATIWNRMQNNQNSTQQQQEEPGMFGKAWKWFKRNILYMN